MLIQYGPLLWADDGAMQSLEKEAYDCVIKPSMLVELSSQVRGVLEEVHVDRGDMVEKGQLIAQLMAGVEVASVELAKSRAEMSVDVKSRKAEKELRLKNFSQIKELHNKKMASVRDYDDAKTLSMVADFELEKAVELKRLAALELNRTEETLKLRYIYSPVKGVVVERNKSPGEFIEEQPVVKIAQIDPLHVEVIMPENKYNYISQGMDMVIEAEYPEKNTYHATVNMIDRIIDASSGTFGVRLTLPNQDYKILAGIRCRAYF